MRYVFMKHNYVISHLQCVITHSMCGPYTREGKMAGVALIHMYIPLLECLENNLHLKRCLSGKRNTYPSI